MLRLFSTTILEIVDQTKTHILHGFGSSNNYSCTEPHYNAPLAGSQFAIHETVQLMRRVHIKLSTNVYTIALTKIGLIECKHTHFQPHQSD